MVHSWRIQLERPSKEEVALTFAADTGTIDPFLSSFEARGAGRSILLVEKANMTAIAVAVITVCNTMKFCDLCIDIVHKNSQSMVPISNDWIIIVDKAAFFVGLFRSLKSLGFLGWTMLVWENGLVDCKSCINHEAWSTNVVAYVHDDLDCGVVCRYGCCNFDDPWCHERGRATEMDWVDISAAWYLLQIIPFVWIVVANQRILGLEVRHRQSRQ